MVFLRKGFWAVILVGMLTLGVNNAARAGAFGVPDPTLGAAVLGWFDLSVEGMDDVLPVVVNASNVNYPAGVGKGVHIIIWNVRSQHVWDRNEPFTPWHVRGFSVRDIILSMPPAQRNQLVVTLDGGKQRFRGYFTAAAVFEFPGTLLPGLDSGYPFTYENHLGGWAYLTNLLEGQADGYALVAVQADTIWSSLLDTFMMSFSADFWNREWFWTLFAPSVDDNLPELLDPLRLESRLFDCNLQDFFYRDADGPDADWLPDTLYRDNKVFERFDTAAGINARLLTRGRIIVTDDAWLAFPEREYIPYQAGSMRLIGRYFKDFEATVANEFANKLVIWTDRNGGAAGRQVQAVVWDENENAVSLPVFFPDELTVLRLDELVGANPAGVIVLDTQQIQSGNGYNPMLGFWRQVDLIFSITAFPKMDLNEPLNGPISILMGLITCPSNVVEGQVLDLTHPNMLQILGWTTTEALAQADLTWGACFQMLRDYTVGTPSGEVASWLGLIGGIGLND